MEHARAVGQLALSISANISQCRNTPFCMKARYVSLVCVLDMRICRSHYLEEPTHQMESIVPTSFEQSTCMGCFTHDPDTYLPTLIRSIKKFLPDIMFVLKCEMAAYKEIGKLYVRISWQPASVTGCSWTTTSNSWTVQSSMMPLP